MVEVAEIFRLHGPQYRAQLGKRLLPSHQRAMQDIEQCRTAACGGQLYFCPQCQQPRYSYHSCKNRHCPKCGNDQATAWLQAQQSLLLPTHYFLVTFTLPAALRSLARSNQRTIYNLLFRAASQALLQLAQDPRFCGGLVGMVGVLHTWTRALLYHPHVHFIVTGGGLSQNRWLAARKDFLVPVKALSPIFRAKFLEQLRQSDLFQQVPEPVWQQAWVVHLQPIGSGLAAFKYLAPYIFRVAISNQRIIKLKDGYVTFKYKDSATKQIKFATVSAAEFMRRFLQHVLPDRFVKVRYYGLLSPACRQLLRQARQLLAAFIDKLKPAQPETTVSPAPLSCPHCGGPLTLLATLAPRGRAP
jgi:Putative transposase/Transposase zinc-binding domain